jgi:macrodomain Ter protein organizer (MatP/YcbG family)
MPRPYSTLGPDAVEPVMSYMTAAAVRDPEMFRTAGSPAPIRVANLQRKLAAAAPDERHSLLDDWVRKHLTPVSRARMFAALRRRRADAKPEGKTSTALRVSTRVASEARALAREMGMPLTLVVETLVAIARSDAELRRQMLKLGVALGQRSDVVALLDMPGGADIEFEPPRCPRRSKFEPPCRPNIEPGLEADVSMVGCA